MSNDLKTYHGAELYAEWTKRGGSLEGWKNEVVVVLKNAGPGPLYRMTDAVFENLFAEVK
jgi:hypothetical protein